MLDLLLRGGAVAGDRALDLRRAPGSARARRAGAPRGRSRRARGPSGSRCAGNRYSAYRSSSTSSVGRVLVEHRADAVVDRRATRARAAWSARGRDHAACRAPRSPAGSTRAPRSRCRRGRDRCRAPAPDGAPGARSVRQPRWPRGPRPECRSSRRRTERRPAPRAPRSASATAVRVLALDAHRGLGHVRDLGLHAPGRVLARAPRAPRPFQQATS